MANINQVVLEGNLVKAAELSRWNDGTPYCRFTLANNESYKDKDGNWIDIPSFIDCVCKGAYAESMHKHLLKGRHITITGRIKQSRWTDEAGNKRSAIVIKVNEISLSPGSFQKEGQGLQQNQNQTPAQNQYQNNEPEYDAEADYVDSDIPF
ncbi:MAG: single-stranded DNA-binding protein [Methanobrevibacter sp.]|nr:single-stranded DNA-binding protein [Methanobrevibacter sp.]